MTSLTIFGGSGFLGKRICQQAVSNGFKVTSLTRSGQPPKPITHSDVSWIKQVSWSKANIFQPLTYQDQLKDSEIVVHSMGVLFEKINYKKVVNDNNFVNSILQFSNSHKIETDDILNQLTYEKLNYESAILLAEEFLNNNPNDKTFVYISAENPGPVIPKGYINSKRNTERTLLELSKTSSLKNLIIRPGFMYDKDDQKSMRSYLKSVIDIVPFVDPSISTEKVASFIIEKLKSENFQHDEIIPLKKLLLN